MIWTLPMNNQHKHSSLKPERMTIEMPTRSMKQMDLSIWSIIILHSTETTQIGNGKLLGHRTTTSMGQLANCLLQINLRPTTSRYWSPSCSVMQASHSKMRQSRSRDMVSMLILHILILALDQSTHPLPSTIRLFLTSLMPLPFTVLLSMSPRTTFWVPKNGLTK